MPQMYDASVDEKQDLSHPRFYLKPVLNEDKSAESGHAEYDDVEYVEIHTPDRLTIVDTPVEEVHRRRWPDKYKAWKEGREAPIEGTPLTQAPFVPGAVCETLNAIHCRSVEQLADWPDDKLPRGFGHWKTLARDWLKTANDASHITTLRRDLREAQAMNENMMEQMKAMQAQIKKLSEVDEKPKKKVRKKTAA